MTLNMFLSSRLHDIAIRTLYFQATCAFRHFHVFLIHFYILALVDDILPRVLLLS